MQRSRRRPGRAAAGLCLLALSACGGGPGGDAAAIERGLGTLADELIEEGGTTQFGVDETRCRLVTPEFGDSIATTLGPETEAEEEDVDPLKTTVVRSGPARIDATCLLTAARITISASTTEADDAEELATFLAESAEVRIDTSASAASLPDEEVFAIFTQDDELVGVGWIADEVTVQLRGQPEGHTEEELLAVLPELVREVTQQLG